MLPPLCDERFCAPHNVDQGKCLDWKGQQIFPAAFFINFQDDVRFDATPDCVKVFLFNILEVKHVVRQGF